MNQVKKIAILGATSQIGKGLICEWAGKYSLRLFGRKPESIESFLKETKISADGIKFFSYKNFSNDSYDLIINATGPGDPRAIKELGKEILESSQMYDDFVLKYLEKNLQTVYIFLSTGAIYGLNYDELDRHEKLLDIKDFYPLSKAIIEAKHRSFPKYKIADIRIFGYFSRFISPEGGFLLSELTNCLLNKKIFQTTKSNFVRDYIGQKDLGGFIEYLINHNALNGSHDIFSSAPTTKSQIINLFQQYGLRYKILDGEKFDEITIPDKISPKKLNQIDLPIRTRSEDLISQVLSEFKLSATGIHIA